MEKYSEILQFSRDLFLHYTEIPVPDENKAALNPPRFMQAATATLKTFCDAFCLKLRKVYKKRAFEIVNTDEQFMTYTIPRCLKLVDDDHYYFSFMLVAAFIEELIQYLEFRRDCYRFSGTAYKCLAAVFKRKFEETFEEKGGWKGLRSFCDKTAYVEDSRKEIKTKADFLTGCNRMRKKHVFQLLKKCDVLHGERFTLNSYELALIAMDDELAIEADLNNIIIGANPSPLEVKWSMLDGNEIFQVFSRFDDETGRVISTRVRRSSSNVAIPAVLDMSSDIETSAVLDPSSDVKTPTVLDLSSDVETPTVLNPSSDVETPTVLDLSSDVETSAVLDPSSDVETSAVLDLSSDVETSAVLDLSWDIETSAVLDLLSDVETSAVLDLSSGVETPVVLDPSSEVEIPVVLDPSPKVENPEFLDLSSDDELLSELEDSGDVDMEKVACDRFAYRLVYEVQPKEFDQKMSTRICEWCDKRCYQYAKYLFGKHTESSMKSKKFRPKFFMASSLKNIFKLFSRNN